MWTYRNSGMMAKKTDGVNIEKGQMRWPHGQAEYLRKWANNLDRKLSASALFDEGTVGIFQRRSILGRFIPCHTWLCGERCRAFISAFISRGG